MSQNTHVQIFAYMQQRFVLSGDQVQKFFFYFTRVSKSVHMHQFTYVNAFVYTQINTHARKSVHVYRALVFCVHLSPLIRFEPRHEISNNVVCATSKASDQPAHTHSLIGAIASHLNILKEFSY